MMTNSAIIIRHLCFTGPSKKAAELDFKRGLNVIYGASDTGKSFVLESIDFMLGGQKLKDIPERNGYDQIFLGIETENGETYTLVRSPDGGQFQLYNGLHKAIPHNIQSTTLIAKSNSENDENISTFILEKFNLAHKKIRKSAKQLQSLSLRNFNHLFIVNEEDIQSVKSPIHGPVIVNKTLEYSIFKLLLTGLDDSKFITIEDTNILTRASKSEVLNELLKEHENELHQIDSSLESLQEELKQIDEQIFLNSNTLSSTENTYRSLAIELENLFQLQSSIKNRYSEINELKAKFNLLNAHYQSDLARLEGIREAGTLVSLIEPTNCPFCGADPKHQHFEGNCTGDLDNVISAADAESDKIKHLKRELEQTVTQLNIEESLADDKIPEIQSGICEIENKIELLKPALAANKKNYSELVDKKTIIREDINTLLKIKKLTDRLNNLNSQPLETTPEKSESVRISTSVLDDFCQQIESILKNWNFPNANRVSFNEKDHDIVISGKRRGSRGKGMRAITHAAFTLALLEYTQSKNLHHPGFVLLDSPLLAYREPDEKVSEEDDLSGTDVQDRFYDYLSKQTHNQTIIIENIDPPISISDLPTCIFFSKNKDKGRYGFFPV
jgi:hypothetical protein